MIKNIPAPFVSITTSTFAVIFVTAWIIASLLSPPHALAQGISSLSEVRIDLWPEYDQPDMLVIKNMTLPASMTLPAEVTFQIPAAAGEPSAVAVRQPDGSLYDTPFVAEQVGNWVDITVTATTPEVVIEYYDPGLIKDGNLRRFEFTWPGNIAVDSMTLRIQQPSNASLMTISGGLGNSSTGSDGLTYYIKELGSIAAGQDFSLELQYQKSSDALTVTSLPVSPGSSIDDTTAGNARLASALPWMLAGFGLLFIVVGGWWYWQSGRGQANPAAPTRSRRYRHAAGEKPTQQTADGEYIYCHQCGNRAAAGDRFCRTCGTPLRT